LLPASLGVALAAALCLLLPALVQAPGCLDAGALLSCLASAGPMMQGGGPPAAVVIAGLIISFAGAVALAAARHARLARSLRDGARSTTLHGLDVGLVSGLDGAVVAGLAQPTIFCSDDLPDWLDDDELRAVLLHERHHQLTWAPLRLVVLSAVAPFVTWSRAGRDWLAGQRAAIEIVADAYALAAGVPRPVLARAIVKLMDSRSGMNAAAFASAADLRLRALVGGGAPAVRTRPAAQVLGAAFVAACVILALV
jgi:Zn-dependent protease with chaperone function